MGHISHGGGLAYGKPRNVVFFSSEIVFKPAKKSQIRYGPRLVKNTQNLVTH